ERRCNADLFGDLSKRQLEVDCSGLAHLELNIRMRDLLEAAQLCGHAVKARLQKRDAVIPIGRCRANRNFTSLVVNSRYGRTGNSETVRVGDTTGDRCPEFLSRNTALN